MAILNTNFTNLTTYPNSFSRQEPTPLEAHSLFTSKTDAENYAKNNPVAYVGQIIVVIDATNKICTPYVISDTTGALGEIGGNIDLDDYVTGPSPATDNAIALYDGTTGKKIKNSGATIDANRNLKFNGPGNISWEDGSYYQRIQVTDDSTVNSAVFTFQQTEDSAKTWNDLFTIQDRGTIIAKNPAGGALSLTLDRGNNANWRWLSDNGNFIAQCDYTDKKGSYFNVLTMAYNTGNVSIDKGTLTSKGGFIHSGLTAASGKTRNDYVLLAGGNTKPLSDFGIGSGGTMDLSDYVKKSSFTTSVVGYLPKIADVNSISPGYAVVTSPSDNWSTTDSAIPTTAAVASYVSTRGFITTDNDTKNTAGATVHTGGPLYLIGAATQDANPQTYSHSSVSMKNGVLTATSYNINSKATWQYNSSTDCVELVW